MSKKLTQKLKELLPPEELKVLESAIETMINDKVNEGVEKKLGELISLKEEELKKKYDEIADKFVKEEVEKQVNDEKVKIVESYDGKIKDLENKLVSKLNSFLEQVIVEQISDELLNKIAINETLIPVIGGIKEVFAKNHIEVDSEGEKIVKELNDKVLKLESDLSEAIAKSVKLDEMLEKSTSLLLISEKTQGLNNSDRKKVVDMFKDKKFEEAEKKIDDYVKIIKEGKINRFGRKIVESKTIEKVVKDDNLEPTKKTVIKEDDSSSYLDEANNYLDEE